MNFLSLGNSTPTTGSTTLIDNDDFSKACFHVTKKQLGYNDGGSFTPVNRIAIIKSDTSEILHVASDQYNLVPNADILQGLDPLFASGYDQVKVRNLFNREFYFELGYEAPAGSEIMYGGLPCKTRVRIINSYNGKTKLALQYGVYIKVCGNGLCVQLAGVNLEYKHSSFVPGDIAQWIFETTQNSVPYIQDRLSEYQFDDSPSSGQENLHRIAKLFPTTKKDDVHPVVHRILDKANKELEQPYTNGNQNFALMMALTNVATYPDANGVPPSYVEKLEDIATELFTVA